MKRPQGFEGTRLRRGPVADDPDAARTQPIRLEAGEKVVARATTEPADERTPPEAPAPSGPVDRVTGEPADERAAGRAAAAAERERRRFERQEMRRFTRRARRRRIAWITGIASVLALAVLAAAVAYSPLMALREVRVEGASRIPSSEVSAAFEDRLGTPLPLIAADEVQESLSAFPLIETYSTETVPPGTLVVRIVERTPVGAVEEPTGFVAVDAAGVVIERAGERPAGLPLIAVEGGLTGDAFRSAGAVLRSLPADLLARVASVTAESPDDVRLEFAEGAVVVWGSAEDSTTKSEVLVRLMAAAPPDSVERYDVSAPLSPVTQ